MKNITSYPSSLVISCHTSAVTSALPFSLPFCCPSSLSVFLSLLSHVSRPTLLPMLYLCSLYFCLFRFYTRPYVSLARAARAYSRYSFFSVAMPSDVWYAEQFRILRLCIADDITINWRCGKSARRCVSNSAIYIELCCAKNVQYKS